MELEKFKNAIGYIRVSTEEQAHEDKYGVEVQKQAILLYANEHHYNIVKWMIEKESGAKNDDERPMLRELVTGSTVTNPPYEAVIIFKNDRLARSIKLYFYYYYTLERRGIKLICTREKFQDGDELADVYRALLQFVAEQERKNIALRTGKGRSIKAACGGYAGGRCPYGYLVKEGRLVINEDEVGIVRHVFKRRDEGASTPVIADELNKLGYRTRKGLPFVATGIRSILENRPLYEGMYKYGKDANWVQGVHEPILKKDGDNE